MIAYLDIKVNAAHPNIPLAPFYAFQASPSNVRIVNVPPRIGKWQLTAVSVTLTLPDNSATTVPAVNVAGCWVATLPGSDVTGYCAAGLQVNASGVDENGAAVTGYCLGIGDVTVLGRDAAIAADGIKYYLHYLADVPEVPRKGDVCAILGILKYYDGMNWQAFAPPVSEALAGETLYTNTLPNIRESIGKIGRALGATVAALAIAALPVFGASVESAALNSLDLDANPQVVTNVDLSGLAPESALTNYYTRAETDDAIDALAAYYITANAEGDAFPSVAALTNATAYYSGGALRTPTRNDYAVVLADETHGGAEWRYIYAVHEGATTGQWEAQYPIETNDYDALSNKPSINGFELSGNKSAAQLGLATPAITNNLATVDALNIVDGTANDAKMGASEADSKAQSALDGLSSRPTYAEAATTATNAAGYAVATADTSYPRFTSATNLNQSVQYLTSAPNNVLTIELPANGDTKDWIVYAYFGVETQLVLPPAIWWMTDEAYTNTIPASTPTAFYFSQVADGIFTLSRQELKSVEIVAP